MRMRKKKHGEERLQALAEYLVPKNQIKPGGIPVLFEDPQKPLFLEIGCGKGDFIIGMAERYPDYNFVAMERVPDVILCAAEKCAAHDLKNIRFLVGNAKDLLTYFAPGEIHSLYLNFSDPWPKAGHVKRRLTYHDFLVQYATILREGGFLAFKTDNAGLFSYSLESFTENNWTCTDITDDLHNSEWNADNIVTEYERNFSEKGFPIHRVVAYPPSGHDKTKAES